MDDINGYYQGNVVVTDSLVVRGSVRGTVTVRMNSRFELNGTVIGKVLAERGSTVNVYGTVDGQLENDDATVHVLGSVKELYDHPGGKATIVDARAYIGRRI